MCDSLELHKKIHILLHYLRNVFVYTKRRRKEQLISMNRSESVLLNNNKQMPMLGLGTFKIKDESELQTALDCAIGCGYRLIDTAAVYRNECAIGSCLPNILAKHGLKRSDIFITTKLGPKDMDGNKVASAVQRSLANLKLEYVDLFLIHWPAKQGMKVDDPNHGILRKQCWKILEDIYHNSDQIKALGVSNYTSQHLQDLLSCCHVKPSVLQCELHPDYLQQDLLEECRANSIHFQAYSSFGTGVLTEDKRFSAIAARHKKTIPQILLRWAIEKGCSVIPKSTNPNHIAANSDIFNFQLSKEDILAIENCTAKTKYCWDPTKVA